MGIESVSRGSDDFKSPISGEVMCTGRNDEVDQVRRGWLRVGRRVVIVCGTSHSSTWTMGAPGRGCEAGGPAEGGGEEWCNGIFAIIGGNCPGIPHWDCPAIWQPIPREENETLSPCHYIQTHPGGRGRSYECFGQPV